VESPFKYTLDSNHGDRSVTGRQKTTYGVHMPGEKVGGATEDVNHGKKDVNAILEALTVSDVEDDMTTYKLHR